MQVKTREEDFQDYLTDASNMGAGHASKLYLPESTEEIAEILIEANSSRTPVTISGARTGTVGGAVPFGGYVISMERLNRIKCIDSQNLWAVVEPGVVLGDFQKAVEAEKLIYPPDPTEWSCQIGGTVATNASGARSFKYGATRRYVQRLRVVLPDGDLLELRRGQNVASEFGTVGLRTSEYKSIGIRTPSYNRPAVTKNVSGYFAETKMDAIDLFIGSEGTLGVITEIELSLLPKPEGFFSGIVFFKSQRDLWSFVDEAKAASFATRAGNGDRNVSGPIDATLIEYFDGRSLGFIAEKFPETPSGMVGAIFFEQETTAENEDELLEGWNDLLERCAADLGASWFTTNEQDRERLRAFRHALPVAVNERVVRNKQKKIGTDMAVPDRNFPHFLRFCTERLEASGIEYVIFGHIGDCHVHANLLPKNDDEAQRSRHLYGRFVAQAVLLGGTVSAEHGIGKLKSKYLHVMMGERYLNEMAEIKKAFDPHGILGRGNMIAERFLS